MPSGLTGDHTAAEPATSSWSVPPRAPPAKLVPPPCSPGSGHASPPPRSLRTGTTTENRRGTSSAVGFSPTPAGSPLPRQPPDAVGPPHFSDAWVRAHGIVPAPARAVSPPRGPSGSARPRHRAPALDRNPPPLPGPTNRESLLFFFFSFSFSHLHIYLYVDILCTKNSLKNL
jgi:hypothetical protein